MADNGRGSMFTHSSLRRECTNYKNGPAELVFLCSLTKSNRIPCPHVIMLAIVSRITFIFNILVNHTRPYLTLKQSFQVKQVSLPQWSPILAHTKVSVHFTGFKNTRFGSVTLRKSIGWNFAPEEKIVLFSPDVHIILITMIARLTLVFLNKDLQ